MSKTIKIIYVASFDTPPVVRRVVPDLKVFQHLVGGFVEAIRPWRKRPLVLWCHEEGKLRQLAPNRQLSEIGDIICGPFFVTRENEAFDEVDLTSEDVAFLLERFGVAFDV